MRCGGITETKWSLLNLCVLALNHKMANLTVCLAEANSPSCYLANSEILIFVFVQTSVSLFSSASFFFSFPIPVEGEKTWRTENFWVYMISCVSPGSVPTYPFLPLLLVLLHHRVCVPFCYNSPLKIRGSFLIQVLMKSDVLEWDSSLTWRGSTLLHAKSEVLSWTVIYRADSYNCL